MTAARVVLPPLGAPVDQLWHVLLDLAASLTVRWTLIGGQMVLLHALEQGQVPPQVSQDGDMVADIRSTPGAVGVVVSALTAHQFDVDGMSPEGVAHRYVRAAEPRPIVVDVLAPEGVSSRTNLTTTPPGRTIQVPGGTQALARTELVELVHEGRSGLVPRPSLLGALVVKAAACGLGGDISRHLRDLALLCALVDDPFEMAEQLTRKDRTRLRGASALREESAPAWALLPDQIRAQGQTAYQLLTADH